MLFTSRMFDTTKPILIGKLCFVIIASNVDISIFCRTQWYFLELLEFVSGWNLTVNQDTRRRLKRNDTNVTRPRSIFAFVVRAKTTVTAIIHLIYYQKCINIKNSCVFQCRITCLLLLERSNHNTYGFHWQQAIEQCFHCWTWVVTRTVRLEMCNSVSS